MSSQFDDAKHIVLDQYGNQLEITDELARGGQGVVFRTSDPDLAIKQPLTANGRPDSSAKLQDSFAKIRCLPIPDRLQISLPVSILDSEPGYVMTLLSDMTPFSHFDINGNVREDLKAEPVPTWLEGMNRANAELFMHYANTGSSKRRHYAMYKCACLLARLHSAGLVYGDVSPNNAFIGDGVPCDVWLIDADNLRFEATSNAPSVYSPGYGAPEVVRSIDSSRPYSDIWAFAIMSFQTLALTHPFIGKAVLNPEDDEGGWDSDDWDADTNQTEKPTDLDEQAYSGYLPFIDDELDDSNTSMSGLPRELMMTPFLQKLYQETLGYGREKPWRRSAMLFWAVAFAQAHDTMLVCPSCKMSYFHSEEECPYCKKQRPRYALISTEKWRIVVQGSDAPYEFALPKRLFEPFSPTSSDDTAYFALIDMDNRSISPVRGTVRFPEDLSITFHEGGR